MNELKQAHDLRNVPGHDASLRALVDCLPDAIARHDDGTRVVYCNPAWETMLRPERHAIGQRVDALFPTRPFMPRYQDLLEQVLASGAPAGFDFVLEDARGVRDICLQIMPETDSSGSLTGLIAIGRDVTRHKELEAELARRTAEFRDVVEHSSDNIARYDRHGRRVYANPALLATLGGDPTRVLGRTPLDSPGGPKAPLVMRTLNEVIACGEMRDVDVRWQAGSQDIHHLVRMIPQFDRAGNVEQVLGIGKDVTEIDRYRRKVHYQSFHDCLTGLPNRASVAARAAQMIADAGHLGQQCAVMVLDLDHFKHVNDVLGQDAGNCLLCATGKRLLDCVGAQDTVARLGDDEFAVLLADVRGADDVAAIASRILKRQAEPFIIEGRELFVTASIGIALFPAHGADAESLFKFADAAVYHAKHAGRNNVQFYARELSMRSIERMDTVLALRKARANGELELYYQPQVDLETGQLIGAEALLRWHRPGRGTVGPDRFIAIAEETGLILDIGEWVLHTACRTAVRWNTGRDQPVKVAVNLSPRQFVRNDLVGTVNQALAATGCRPEWLELEITEGLLLEDGAETMAILEELAALKIAVLVDDFGTGYSALGYLYRFPFSHLKIDRSFVNGIPDQFDKCELVRAMLMIAAALDLGAIAEGVETHAQAAFLRARGCRTAQGFLFGRPMPIREFEALLANSPFYVTEDNYR